MRDPNRIDTYVEKLKTMWKKVPDWRFGQLLNNVLGTVLKECKQKDTFYIEDEEFFTAFEKALNKIINKEDNI